MLSELQTASRVVDRLGSRFPGAPLTVIKDAVAAAQHEYANATMRGYLPFLIERAAREAMLRIGYPEARDTRDTASGRPGPPLPAGHVPMETIFNARVATLTGGWGD
jgi:hypothetical protein